MCLSAPGFGMWTDWNELWKKSVARRLIRKVTFPHVDDHGLIWLSDQINLYLLCGVVMQYC